MQSNFSSDGSDSFDESENGHLEEDIQTLIKESNKKIQADTKQQKSGNGIYTRDYSVDKPSSKLLAGNVPVDAFRKNIGATPAKVNENVRPSTSAKPSRGIDKTKAYELFDESDNERQVKPLASTATKLRDLGNQGPRASTATSSTRASTSKPTSTANPSSTSSRPAQPQTPTRQWTQSRGQGEPSPTKGVSQQEASASKVKTLADLQTAHARDTSTDTIKKKTTPKKQKIKHKLSMMCYHEKSEIPLVKHFIELGEWKRVLKFDDADFTFVNNERKLDWDVALRTMVDSLLKIDQQDSWCQFPRTEKRTWLHSKQVQGGVLL